MLLLPLPLPLPLCPDCPCPCCAAYPWLPLSRGSKGQAAGLHGVKGVRHGRQDPEFRPRQAGGSGGGAGTPPTCPEMLEGQQRLSLRPSRWSSLSRSLTPPTIPPPLLPSVRSFPPGHQVGQGVPIGRACQAAPPPPSPVDTRERGAGGSKAARLVSGLPPLCRARAAFLLAAVVEGQAEPQLPPPPTRPPSRTNSLPCISPPPSLPPSLPFPFIFQGLGEKEKTHPHLTPLPNVREREGKKKMGNPAPHFVNRT